MSGPPRRRIDFSRLPVVSRYALALAVLAFVVAIVLLVRGDAPSTQPAGWYTAVVRIGALALLGFAVAWLVRQVLRMWRR